MKIFKQETGKSCGVACLRSILNHYGNNFSEEDIWNKHVPFRQKTGEILNPIISLGVTALKFGFDVTYVGYNPRIANNNTSSNLKKSLERKSRNYYDYGKFCVDEALQFLELKGKLKIDMLNIEKIKKIIDKNKFALVRTKPAFINGRSPIMYNHEIIICGYTKNGFNILDPHDAKKHFIEFDTFLLAFYAAIPELLIIKKKK
jgi:hypothetical protein